MMMLMAVVAVAGSGGRGGRGDDMKMKKKAHDGGSRSLEDWRTRGLVLDDKKSPLPTLRV